MKKLFVHWIPSKSAGKVIQESQSQASSNYAFTTYHIQVNESIKGNLSGDITVSVPGTTIIELVEMFPYL